MSRATELLEQATPLPWRSTGPTYPDGDQIWLVGNGHQEQFIAWTDASLKALKDFELMAYAVNRLPDYEAAVALLRRGAERWHGLSEDPLHMSNIFRECPDEYCTAVRAALSRLRDKVPA